MFFLFAILQAPSEEDTGERELRLKRISVADQKSHRELDVTLGCQPHLDPGVQASPPVSRGESLYSEFLFTPRNYVHLGNFLRIYVIKTNAFGRQGITELCWMDYNPLEKVFACC